MKFWSMWPRQGFRRSSMSEVSKHVDPEKIAEAREELVTQVKEGHWSGLVDTAGGPIYTLKEIAAAILRELLLLGDKKETR